MRDKITNIVINSINSLNAFLDRKIPIEQREKCALYGEAGELDSLALVSLIVTIEENIEREFNVNLILANEKAMSQKNSPFLSVQTLVNYIESLMKSEVAYV